MLSHHSHSEGTMATLRKRNNKWQAQIRRHGRKPISNTFLNKADALQWAREKEVEADKHDLLVDLGLLRKTTIGELVDRYLEEITPFKKSAQAETYVLKAFQNHKICKSLLSEITHSLFAKYRDQRLLKLSPAGLKRELNPIHNMFEIARDERGIPLKENPLAKLKLKATDNRREIRIGASLKRIIFFQCSLDCLRSIQNSVPGK